MERKVILYIASSLDGFIAANEDNLDFLNAVMKEGQDYGYATFTSSIDTVIVGKRTYDWVMNQVNHWPHADKTTYIITHQQLDSAENIQFYSGDLGRLIEKLKAEDGLNIYCDGGGQLVTELLKLGLIDEIILSIIPVILGDGVELIQDVVPERSLILLESQTYDTGLVQLHYSVEKPRHGA